MLVVSRKPGEMIDIPSVETQITIERVKGDTVRIGIIAPRDILVLRHELIGQDEKFISLIESYSQARQINHSLRGQLQSAGIGANLLRKQIEAQASISEIYETLDRISRGTEVQEEAKVTEWMPTALIVEDDPNERELLAGMLRYSGINVITSNDGDSALDYLAHGEKKPDVVLLDMGLPTLNGAEVAGRIRKDFDPKLKIFVISGQEKQIGPNVDRWFQKPLNPETLMRDIKRIKVG